MKRRKYLDRFLAALLTIVMAAGAMPMTALAAEPTQNAPEHRIVHVDCGRKYFSPENLKKIIDNAASAGFNEVELYLSDNQGFRLELDDMNVTIPVSSEEAEQDPVLNGEEPAEAPNTEPSVSNEEAPKPEAALTEQDEAAEAEREPSESMEDSADVAETAEEAPEAAGQASRTIDLGPALGDGYAEDNKAPDGSDNYIRQADMNDIIHYAKSKGVEIVPCINVPGHMGAVLQKAAPEYCAEGSRSSLDLENPEALAFGLAVTEKYASYFAERGCRFYNLGADEYALDKGQSFYDLSDAAYGKFVEFMNGAAGIVKEKGMTPRAFNDSYTANKPYEDLDKSIQICYWAQINNVVSANGLEQQGYSLINTNQDHYWVLGNSGWQCSPEKAAEFDVNQFHGSRVSAPAGAMFCIWCDNAAAGSQEEVVEETAPVIAAFGSALTGEPAEQDVQAAPPVKAPAVKSVDSYGVPNRTDGGQPVVRESEGHYTIELSEADSLTSLKAPEKDKFEEYRWRSDNTNIASVDTDGKVSFTGQEGTVKIEYQRLDEHWLWGSEWNTIRTYTFTITNAPVPVGGDLSMEFWVTNRKVTADGKEYKMLSKDLSGITEEAGIPIDRLAPARGTRMEQGSLKQYIFWHARVLPAGKHQTEEAGTGSDMSGTGAAVSHIRYWEGAWQYRAEGRWQTFKETDQLTAYYLEQYDLAQQVNASISDWGIDRDKAGLDRGVTFILIDADGRELAKSSTYFYGASIPYGVRNILIKENDLAEYNIVRITKQYEKQSYWQKGETAAETDIENWENGFPLPFRPNGEAIQKNKEAHVTVRIYVEANQLENSLTVEYRDAETNELLPKQGTSEGYQFTVITPDADETFEGFVDPNTNKLTQTTVQDKYEGNRDIYTNLSDIAPLSYLTNEDRGDDRYQPEYISAGVSEDKKTLTVYFKKAGQDILTYAQNSSNAFGSTAPTTGQQGYAVSAAECGFTNPGFVFAGWNTQPDGKGTAYQPGDKYTLTEGNDVLYAQWSKGGSEKIIITANSETKEYNREEQSVTGYTVEYISPAGHRSKAEKDGGYYRLADGLYLEANSVEAIAKGTNAGTYGTEWQKKNIHFQDASGLVGKDLTASYLSIVEYVDGSLTITPKDAKITVNDAEKYEGEEDPVFSGTVSGLIAGDEVAGIKYVRTNAEVNAEGSYKDVLSAEYEEDPNYNITVETGDFTIKARKDMTDAEANAEGFHVTYDGETHSIQTVNTIDAEVSYTVDGEAVSPDAVNVSDSKAEVTVTFTKAGYNTKTVEVPMIIDPKEVTITADDKEKSYGEADPELTAKSLGTLNGDQVAYTELSRAAGEAVGTYPITVTGNEDQGNYKVTFVNGTFTIKTNETALAFDTAKTKGYEGKYDGEFHNGVKNVAVTLNGEAFLVETPMTVEYKTEGTEFTTENPQVKNVSDSQDITVRVTIEGYQPIEMTVRAEVKKREVTLKSEGAEKEYDGTALTRPVVSVTGDGFVAGEAEVKATGSRTNAGTCYNRIEITKGENYKEENYEITEETGLLIVKPTTEEIVITVRGNDMTISYTGEEVSTSGFKTDADGRAQIVLKEGSKAAATASGTEAGTYYMPMTEEDFDVYSTNYSNIKLNVVKGKLLINPCDLSVLVTIKGHEKLDAVYTGKEQKAEGYDVVSIDFTENPKYPPEYTKEMITFVGTAEAKGTKAGTYPMGLTAEDFQNNNPNFTNVSFAVEDGRLIISPNTANPITVTAKSAEKVYDGKPLSLAEVTYTADRLMEGDVLKAKTKGAQTNAGTSENKVTEVKIMRGEEDVTDSYVIHTADSALTVKQRPVAITVNDAEKAYGKADPAFTGTVEAKNADRGLIASDDLGEVTYKRTGENELVGKYENVLTAEYTENANYAVTVENGDFTITGDDLIPEKTTPEVTSNYKLGEKIPFEIRVKNVSAAAVENVTVNDPTAKLLDGAGYTVEQNIASIALIPAGGEVVVYAEHTVTSEDIKNGTYGNTAEITAGDQTYTVSSETDRLDEMNTSLAVDKTTTSTPANGTAYALGEKITFNIAVKNTGNVPYKNVIAEDVLEGAKITAGTGYTVNEDGNAVIKTLAVGKTVNVKAEYIVTSEDVLAGKVVNNAAVTADPADPDDPSTTPENEDTEEVTIEDLNTALAVDKTTTSTPANGTAYALGEKITFNIAVKNTGNVPYKNVIAEDVLEGAKITAGTGYTVNEDGNAVIKTLAVGETVNVKAEYIVTSEDVLAGKVVNNAAVTADPADPDDSSTTPENEDTEEVTIEDLNRTLNVNKETTNSPAKGTAYGSGETITYDITVTNNGNVPYTNVVVTDTLAGAVIVNGTGYTLQKGKAVIDSLAVGESVVVKAEYTVQRSDLGTNGQMGSILNGVTAEADAIKGEKPENKAEKESAVKAALTIRANDNTVVYDGAPHGKNLAEPYIVTGDLIPDSRIVSVTVSGERTNVGRYEGILVPSDAKIESGSVDITDLYEITYENGTLEITNNTTALEFTANTKGYQGVYDGKNHDAVSNVEVKGLNGQIIDPSEMTVEYNTDGSDDFTAEMPQVKNVSDSTAVKVRVTVPNYAPITMNVTAEVTPRPVTMESATASKVYDGTPLTAKTVEAEGFVDGEGASYTVTGTQTNVGTSKNTFSYELNSNTKAENYNITKTEGTLTVTQDAENVIILKASDAEKVYDGEALVQNSYSKVSGDLAVGDELVVTVEGSQTDAGESANVITEVKVMRGEDDVTANYVFGEHGNGTLKVTKKAVTLTSETASKAYDGTPLTANTVEAEGFVDGEGASYTVIGTQTNVGTSSNTFSYELNSNTKADNYDITRVEGTLTVTQDAENVIILKASDAEKVYDGTALVQNSYVRQAGTLADGDELVVTVEGSQTDAGESANVITEVKVMRGTDDVTANYVFGEHGNGTLKVTKRDVTLTSATASKAYDGTPLTANTVKAEGFVDGEGASYTVTGTQTNVGTSKNTFSYELNSNTKAENYNITTVEGTLTVTQDAENVIILKASDADKVYDGEALVQNSYVKQAGTLAAGDELVVKVEGSQTDAGESANVITEVKVMRGTDDVTANYVFGEHGNGTLKVTKRPVTLTSETATKAYDGTELTRPVVTITDEVLSGQASAKATGSITNVGSVENTIVLEPAEGFIAENYEITYAPGTLSITKAAFIPDEYADAEGFHVVYDGKEHSIKVTNTIDAEVSFTVDGKAVDPTATNVADSEKAVTVTFTHPNYEDKVVTVEKVITARSAQVLAENKTKVYGESDPELTAVTKGTLNGDPILYTLEREAGEDAGTYTITAAGAAEQGNYLVTFSPAVLTIEKAPFIPDEYADAEGFRVVYDSKEHSIKVTNTIDAEVSFMADGKEISSAAVNVDESAEQVTVIFTHRNYEPKTVVVEKVITPKAVTVTPDNKHRQVGGKEDPELTASVTGTLNGDTVEYVLSREPGTSAGNYTIFAEGDALQGNYIVTYETGVFRITNQSGGGGGNEKPDKPDKPDEPEQPDKPEVPEMLDGENHFAYVKGYPDGTVRPQNNITRAEVAAIFFRLLTEETRAGNIAYTSSFDDVSRTKWYSTSICTMAALDIVMGRSADEFDPEAPITRAEFASIAFRFDKSDVTGGKTFTDIAGHWAEGNIKRAAALGWISGYPDGSFGPDRYITRAEAMSLINRVLKRVPETPEDLMEGMIVWPDNNVDDWFYLAVQEATNSHDYVRKGTEHESWIKLTPNRSWDY